MIMPYTIDVGLSIRYGGSFLMGLRLLP